MSEELDDIAAARDTEKAGESKVWLKTEHVFAIVIILMLVGGYFAFKALP